MDVTGTGSCPTVDNGISSAQPSGSASTVLVFYFQHYIRKKEHVWPHFASLSCMCIITAFDSNMCIDGLPKMAIVRVIVGEWRLKDGEVGSNARILYCT